MHPLFIHKSFTPDNGVVYLELNEKWKQNPKNRQHMSL